MTSLILQLLPFRALKTLSPVVLLLLFSGCETPSAPEPQRKVDVLVIGGGTGGTAAGIQAARMGSRTLIVEPTAWLGGMLTAAGVSAIDGNHLMPAGIWGEFRDSIYAHYGGPDAVATGWVSMTQFEPKIGARIFANMAARETTLEVWHHAKWRGVEAVSEGWLVRIEYQGKEQTIAARILIDGTDMGDIAAAAGVPYDLGMDARATTGESMAPEQANGIIQDLTYVAILKDYGPDADKTIPEPEGYDPSVFDCACREKCEDPEAEPHPCATMMTYAKLPNEKYLINWPLKGNDYYADVVEMTETQREEVYRASKNKTLQFVYYIQKELGFRHLGLADDEYPSEDLLPLLPYYREGRRIHGLVQLTVNHILDPYVPEFPLYRTGIAVGDYPIDHHHKERPDAPEINFPPVPSFNIPLGTLIPEAVPNLLMADKALSVSNIVNGSSRLQPVILQVGQAAGITAALAVQQSKTPADLSVREVQDTLLACQGYLMPYFDVERQHPHLKAIHRIGACGILKGVGEPYKWANRTWFYPDSTTLAGDTFTGLKAWGLQLSDQTIPKKELLTLQHLQNWLPGINSLDELAANWPKWGFSDFTSQRPLTRTETAVIIDRYLDPFHQKDVNFKGQLIGDGNN